MRAAALGLAVLLAACGPSSPKVAPHSSTIAVSADGKRLVVVNPDSDSLSVLDLEKKSLSKEITLGSGPVLDADGNFTPQVMPRSVALSSDGNTAWVAGERSGQVLKVDLGKGAVSTSATVGSEPIDVLLTPGGDALFVSVSQDDQVLKLNPSSLKVEARLTVDPQPWALALSDDEKTLLVTHFLGSQLSALDAQKLTLKEKWLAPDAPSRGDKRLAHGQARGLYDVAARPGGKELWVADTWLATDTAQPDLDFESTAFPALHVFDAQGHLQQVLSTDAQDVPGVDGAFFDVVSMPRALVFTSDGRWALMADAASEDLMLVDAERKTEAQLLRPLPGHLPEGLALSPDGTRVYVDERNSGDVAVVKLDATDAGVTLSVDSSIARLKSDPMPKEVREGQHIFNSANSDELPITNNHWVSCSICHFEGRTDAVVWKFFEGPRDTPSNAGGVLGTGFLMHTAARAKVQDYWVTIAVEQGGNFDPADPLMVPRLDALSEYVNRGIPRPMPPTTDSAKVAAGKMIFESAEVQCATCHPGPRLTDSGAGNPNLDLAGTVLLHDVGTCNSGDFPDVSVPDVDGHPREACQFDTPSLTGVASSAPYLHDGSAATLREVLEKTRGKMGDITHLDDQQLDQLVEYLRSL